MCATSSVSTGAMLLFRKVESELSKVIAMWSTPYCSRDRAAVSVIMTRDRSYKVATRRISNRSTAAACEGTASNII